jgi:hypothetical protein
MRKINQKNPHQSGEVFARPDTGVALAIAEKEKPPP